MNPSDKPMPDAWLHAYVDGQLPPDRLARVLDWLAAHPEDAARVQDWQAQRLALRQLGCEDAAETLPPVLLRPVLRHQRRARWWQGGRLAAACLMALGLGVVAGRHWPGPAAEQRWAQAPGFAAEALAAHVAFVPERRHPVEVSAAEEAHLVQWLGRRLGTPLRAPELQGQGFHLLGGRLLPGGVVPQAASAAVTAPRAQFMYENGQGQRLTLYVAIFDVSQPPAPVAFQQQRLGAQATFYWTEERLGYALSAPAELPLAELAAEVHRQLSP